jgi:acyl-CoA dehydrogenase
MVDFKLTDEQLALQQTARKFAQTEMAPQAAHYDQTGEFPRSIIENAWKVGLINESIPAEYGGLGLDGLSACVLTEELAAGCAGMTTSMMVNTLGQTPILVGGSKEQIEQWIVPFTREFRFSSFCLTEPSSGSDVANMNTTAKKVGDKYVLNGRKCFITNGGVADVFTVFATLDPAKGHKGICAFVVAADTPGVSAGKKEDKMGQRASNTTDVLFEDAAIPAENLLGREGRASRSRCRRSTAHAPRSALWPWAWRGAPTSTRCATRVSETPSACPSRCSRPSSSCSPTWRRTSRRPGCSPGRRPG